MDDAVYDHRALAILEAYSDKLREKLSNSENRGSGEGGDCNIHIATMRWLDGCNILPVEDTQELYSMPLRLLSKAIEQSVEDHNNPRAWCEYAQKNESLSKSERVACLQRCVILDKHYAGWWYILGCHYELEGMDWYGAANAFNHVIFLNPKHAAGWFSLSQLWARRGIMSKAQEYLARYEEVYVPPEIKKRKSGDNTD